MAPMLPPHTEPHHSAAPPPDPLACRLVTGSRTRGASVSADDAPWPELARGRSSSGYDLGDGRVLRRNAGADAAWEAGVLAHAQRRRVRVPPVYEAPGHDLVMERIEGPPSLPEPLAH